MADLPLRLALWQSLEAHARRLAGTSLRSLFADDADRATRMSLEACGIFFDFSKQRLDDAVLSDLLKLAVACGVRARTADMFAGRPVNESEARAVLHVALRANADSPDALPEVRSALAGMTRFADSIRRRTWLGHGGRPIRDVVHIGVGGSDLGPRLLCDALGDAGDDAPRLHFVSNADATDMAGVLRRLSADSTLFIIASKSFTTFETISNAYIARDWYRTRGVPEDRLERHFVAVTSAVDEAVRFGVAPAQVFPLWDWVGGRYSLWSAVSLSIALRFGMRRFQELLAGARAMDEHFATATHEQNIPVLLALAGIWNANFLGSRSLAIVPYDQRLALLPAHLQQLEMESNGKSVSRSGASIPWHTAPALWGQVGTNAQHAFFQWLHQGTDPTPVDFIAVIEPRQGNAGNRQALLANCLAQSAALMLGKPLDEARAELVSGDISATDALRLAPHLVFPGDRPSSTLLLSQLDAPSLGALLAMYEHKVFVQGVLWDINSFDQWGVEWGKQLAREIDAELASGKIAVQRDASTRQLINRIRRDLTS